VIGPTKHTAATESSPEELIIDVVSIPIEKIKN